ncbi:hypothetical protein TRFO_36708 [Tritrichomonas foetus]|uniref:KATNIP domain-containing protein n=1 Tax=Tritrichomonas foetus TaxID=1144522 RepID=A0A1J4JD74_9EUKA|nr:hypothetical protein TRFO_36708 [Tritrichomonas foetus]|eukprot:OHS97150.1 hypothetical protein TRFO_36708 [Tritrichomonas foetus]
MSQFTLRSPVRTSAKMMTPARIIKSKPQSAKGLYNTMSMKNAKPHSQQFATPPLNALPNGTQSVNPGKTSNLLALLNDKKISQKKSVNDILENSDIACKIMKIRIHSNWGHPHLIGCSRIDILAQNKSVIPIVKEGIEPPIHQTDDLNKLVNGNLIKMKEEDTWKAKWPPEVPLKSIDINFSFPSAYIPMALRIWPTVLDQKMNLKDVTIFVEDTPVYSGSLPLDVGTVIPVNKDLSEIINIQKESTFDKFKQIIAEDTHGTIPLKPAQVIDFHIVETYGDPKSFGFSRLRIFDEKGQIIDVLKLATIEAIHCGKCSPPKELFYEGDLVLQRNSIWKATFHPGKSCIRVRFHTPMIVAGFLVDTYRYPFTLKVNDISVKGLKIAVDGRMIWFGRLKHSTKEAEKAITGDCSSLIFTFANREIQHSIRNIAYTP